MSTRQMRRLRKQQEDLQMIQNTEENGPSENDDDEPAPPKPRANAFAGFAALADTEDGGDEEQENDENDDGDYGEDHANDSAVHNLAADTSTPPPKKAKKPKKKKKGKKAKKEDTDAAAVDPVVDDDEIDEIDKAIEELKLAQAQRQPESSGKWEVAEGAYDAQKLSGLLKTNFQHLKAMNEMRKVFGKEAIDAAIAEDTAQEAANRAERLRQQRVDLETYLRAIPGKPMSDVVLKRNPFIDGKKSWPSNSTAGLTMKSLSGANDAIAEYTFAHEKYYDELEREFFHLVQTYDPMNIVHFLHRHAYHISSLIQVSKIAKQDQNSALSAELCERALFTFGRVTLSSFRKKLEQGQARLDFRRPENRQFYLAGYNYIKNLIRKGTYRTALEWTKLFVSLDPADPYGMLNWLHVLAIRAHEAEWFVELCSSQLLTEGNGITTSLYIKQTLALAKLQLKDTAGAKAALIEGMERLPWLFAALFSQLNLDIPKSIWGAQPRDESEELHTKLYLHVAMDLWNNPQATDMLLEAARSAQKVSDHLLPASPEVSLATARFVYLDDTPSMLALVPRGMLDVSPNFDFDPLPPPKEENMFSSEVQMLPWSDSPTLPRQLDMQGMLEMIERHVDEETGRARDGDGETARGGATGGAAWREAALQAINDYDGAGGAVGLINLLNRLRQGGLGTGEPVERPPLENLDLDPMPGAWGDEDDFEDSGNDEDIAAIEAENGQNWLQQLFGRGTRRDNQTEAGSHADAADNAAENELNRHARVEDAEEDDEN